MHYDVLAINLSWPDSPVDSVRIVRRMLTASQAPIIHRNRERQAEREPPVREFFAIMPTGMYVDGEMWQGTKEAVRQDS